MTSKSAFTDGEFGYFSISEWYQSLMFPVVFLCVTRTSTQGRCAQLVTDNHFAKN